MFKSLLVSFGLSLALPMSAFAVRAVGNGGHLVVCKDSAGRVKSMEVLDLYEAKHMGPIELGAPSLAVNKKVELAISRVAKHDEALARDLRSRAAEFFKTATYREDLSLPESNDAGQVILGDGCALHQLALQQMSPLPGGKFYVVNGRFWRKLSGNEQAALVLHEVIYSYFNEKGAKTSQTARLFNALLLQDKFADMKKTEFKAFVKRLIEGKDVVDYGVIVSPTPPQRDGTRTVVTLNETFFKAETAQSATLPANKKCFVPAKINLVVEFLSKELENDHYKVKLWQSIPGCDFGAEGTVGYLFSNHIR